MQAPLPGSSPLEAVPPIPNNLGPTLLVAIGVPLLPLLIGAPLTLLGLSRLRAADGALVLPQLDRAKRWIRLHALRHLGFGRT